jgi:hypothetical protein
VDAAIATPTIPARVRDLTRHFGPDSTYLGHSAGSASGHRRSASCLLRACATQIRSYVRVRRVPAMILTITGTNLSWYFKKHGGAHSHSRLRSKAEGSWTFDVRNLPPVSHLSLLPLSPSMRAQAAAVQGLRSRTPASITSTRAAGSLISRLASTQPRRRSRSPLFCNLGGLPRGVWLARLQTRCAMSVAYGAQSRNYGHQPPEPWECRSKEEFR